EERYRTGPGLTGDEILSDLKTGKFAEESVHVNFIYGFYNQNVIRYHRLYRVSGGDAYYLDQMLRYAEGIEWILENRPQQLLPEGRRDDPLPNPVAEIPHEPAAMANFLAHANAARLLLERAREKGRPRDDPGVLLAKKFLSTFVKYADSQISGDFKPFSRKRGAEPDVFEPGEKTKQLMKQFSLPTRAAQIIEYTPWNQTFFYFATLTAATLAMEDLHKIEGGATYQNQIDLYRNIVRAGFWNLQHENICVVREGVPYFFHMHTPLRDGESKTRLGFPMFGAEDVAHSTSGAWHLPFIWEAGKEFSVSPALLAGYTNTMAITNRDRSQTHKNGKPWPRAHLDSPWYLAAADVRKGVSSGMKGRYYPMMAFAPDIVASNRPFARSKIWEDETDLNRLYAGYLYRLWMKRR
ncbi:MAG: hypothetical protein AAF585_18535, partial [Verrucomicrobiota bacterium]